MYLKAVSTNLGNRKVTAAGGTVSSGDGGVGRVRLDYNSLSGTTIPEPYLSTNSPASLSVDRSLAKGDILGLTSSGVTRFMVDTNGFITQNASGSTGLTTDKAYALNVLDQTQGTGNLTGLYINWTASSSAASGSKNFAQFQKKYRRRQLRYVCR